ncbi:two-component system response regulator PilR (NtrC family) [Panacagrimonas perspica]|uniref:Two-component system response regulator PilR (NtrC family) n=1 Tax=Panacagrimonas perspica TaxID=381431 RepID=A0A4R7P3F1_9GAMM|nr:sigma-54 dependent transcriptional regulator [Panacagrimonas perspica]TDU28177.1 two-component system response regulator PilR (NtrC family) [Panacagrimonas perspica]THD01266.1 sigma-54-dependent Fis family transcriptional regulator [Panacagrimonas perspica]
MSKSASGTSAPLALIVDDESDIRELLEITLSRMGIKCCAAADLAEARQWLKERTFDFCITDMRLPDGNGIDLVRLVQSEHSRLPIAVITAHGNAQAAVESLKAGAFDFVSKPVDLRVLRKLVETALQMGEAAASEPEVKDGGLLGAHESVVKLRQLIERLARSQAPVHIHGESGTGKELVARLIHDQSPRAAAPFVPVNCGAIPSELMESEFFGHLKGSFTGAMRDKGGLFQAAEGGTLFLDEIADLPLHMQVKLLRAIQERAIRPVGAEAEIHVNVRLISATHKNLVDLVARGAFRQDLYYRVNVIEVRTPPLRSRGADIPMLADHMLVRLCKATGVAKVPKLDEGAQRLLLSYEFPGNVRELENMLERALTLCDGEVISADDLQLRNIAPVSDAHAAVSDPHAATPAPSAAVNTASGLDDRVEELERQAIRDALEKTRYNKTKAAALLGLTFRQLRYKVKKLNLE